MKLLWLPRALRNLVEIHDYIAFDNLDAAREVIRRVRATASLLDRHPQAGRLGRVKGTRELMVPGTPYLIAHRVKAAQVEVLVIQHGAQQWPERL